MDKTAKQIQALLFAEGGALTYASIARSLGCGEKDLPPALDALSAELEGSGLALLRSDTEAALVVAPDAREVVTKKLTEEYERDIGDAGLEVLAILLYEGPSTRATIDYIRGVNSSSTIRNLLSRGLVERSGNPEDGREFIYRATVELLAHVGVTQREKLPEYDMISRELAAFKATENHGGGTGTESA
ncbi:MAG TPA: SMC-Scp complex subunit ScpB [Candidatus Paceibacterota bacterium]|nr:SMC-Scp complex subunit ScpB [Candidatus Paceibacterota bacterium]